MNLAERLVRAGKTRWLDVGCGGIFDKGFHYVDLFQPEILDPAVKGRYYRADIVNAPSHELTKLGKFDLVRMQHVFEHFTLEEGQKVLKNCALLLKKGGLIVISVPDLRINIQRYLEGRYKSWSGFNWWAHKRIPKNSPDSFYFSIFAHSMPFESHKWCYDAEGLVYQLKHTGRYRKIRELKLDDPLANVPFTHNRPTEDVCVIAVRS